MIENASYAENGSINATIDGLVVSIPNDPDNIDFQAVTAWAKEAGNAIAAYAAPAPSLADYSDALQMMLDAKAGERQYDSIQTGISYRGDPNAQFAAEGNALFDWRSAVWTYATEQLGKVQSGERAQPSVEHFIAEVAAACPFAWPSGQSQ